MPFGPGSSLQFRLPPAITLRDFHCDPIAYAAATHIVQAAHSNAKT